MSGTLVAALAATPMTTVTTDSAVYRAGIRAWLAAAPHLTQEVPMPSAEAHVSTERASSYLTQLGEHLRHMGHRPHHPPAQHDDGPPPAVQHADWTDTAGTIHFDQGTCTLRATPDALILRLEAVDEHWLRRLQDGLARRLENIGRRDELAVTWHAVNPPV